MQRTLAFQQRRIHSLTDIRANLAQAVEQASSTRAFAGLKGERGITTRWILGVQAHQQIDVEVVVGTSRCKVGDTQSGTIQTGAQALDLLEGRFDFAASSANIA